MCAISHIRNDGRVVLAGIERTEVALGIERVCAIRVVRTGAVVLDGVVVVRVEDHAASVCATSPVVVTHWGPTVHGLAEVVVIIAHA
jgi:hypothetical protein